MAVYNRRTGIMLAHPFEEKRLYRDFPSSVLVQPKLDGLRCRAIRLDHEVVLISSEGHKIESLPIINSQLSSIPKEVWAPYSYELDGEIYTHGKSFEQIISFAKRKQPKPGHIDIHYHVFDLKKADVTNYTRNNALSRLFHLPNAENVVCFDNIKQVETTIVENSITALYTILDHYVSEGYEGIIVRNPTGIYEEKRSKNMLKIKPRKEDIYTIVGYREETDKDGNPKGSLGALVCVSQEGEEFKVGSGFTQEQRRDMWMNRNYLSAKKVRIKYQGLTADRKVPRFPILAEIIQ